MLNLHHLELFYYVARHQGIVPACRHIPYGIQQPAVSAQMIRLEEDLGTSLFRRRPFQLTPAGERLYEAVAPFFGNLETLEKTLRGETTERLRLVGLSEVMRNHAPDLLARLKKRHPRLQLTLIEAEQRAAEQLILRGEADLAVTVLEHSGPASGLRCRTLLKLPLVLLVPENSPCQSAAEALHSGEKGNLDLISLPPHELISRLFQQELERRGRRWPIALQVTSAELIGPYVARGLGAGLSVSTPHLKLPAGVRELPLKKFPSLSVGAFWAGRLTPIAAEFLEDLSSLAKA